MSEMGFNLKQVKDKSVIHNYEFWEAKNMFHIFAYTFC